MQCGLALSLKYGAAAVFSAQLFFDHVATWKSPVFLRLRGTETETKSIAKNVNHVIFMQIIIFSCTVYIIKTSGQFRM
jgi:hypothetical protein